jgi:chromosome partitioning protein
MGIRTVPTRRDLKPMSIVAIVSQKGGVAKSTLSIHLAVEAVRKKKRTVILELDKQGTTSLLWSQRRAERHRPEDLVKAMGDQTPPQPEVHRVDSSNLEIVLEQMRRGGIEFVVLDLPGAHNPAVSKAIAASDYILIPTRPNDVDLHASLETADVARRLKKPFAYIFTFVPPTGQDEAKMREALEDSGLTVAPKGLGDRRKEYGEAIANGSTVQEMKAGSASAIEVRAIWRWLEQQLEVVHGRKAA